MSKDKDLLKKNRSDEQKIREAIEKNTEIWVYEKGQFVPWLIKAYKRIRRALIDEIDSDKVICERRDDNDFLIRWELNICDLEVISQT
jgi:hypothetical protein